MIIECKLCLKQGLSSESHIIPRSLLKDVYLHNNRDEPSKKHPIGIYDRHILCQLCEATYMKWDGHPKTFFDNPFNNQKALAVYQNNQREPLIISYESFVNCGSLFFRAYKSRSIIKKLLSTKEKRIGSFLAGISCILRLGT
jgi:hypothetical protein